MLPVKHLFFDLDHTLWDYERSANETLNDLFDRYAIADFSVTKTNFRKAYHKVNWELWDLYNKKEIDRSGIRERRFRKILSSLGIHKFEHSFEEMSTVFINECSSKPHLFPNTLETLEALSKKYTLHILTNSFKEIAVQKLKSSGIEHYFKTLVSSECCPYRKPEKGVFAYSLELAGASALESIMIGDNPESDALCALNASIPAVTFNPEDKVFPTLYHSLEIQDLIELTKDSVLEHARQGLTAYQEQMVEKAKIA